MTEQTPVDAAQRVECPPTREPSVRQFMMTAILLGFGLYSIWELVYERYQPDYYYFTIACAVLFTPLGLVPLTYGLIMLRRRLVADEVGLGYLGKDKIPWNAVRRLVARGKGLLDVEYDLDGPGVLKLDSWYFQNFDALVAMIEAKTPGVPTESARK